MSSVALWSACLALLLVGASLMLWAEAVRRREREASGLGGAEAAGSDEMKVGICVEQSERRDVDRKRADERVCDLLERKDEIATRNGCDRLAEGLVSRFALGEETSRANRVGEVDSERDDDLAPAVGVDAVETGAPPPGFALGRLVTELGQVLRRSGCSHFPDKRREFGAEGRVVDVLKARAGHLFAREVANGEAGQRQVGVQDLERVGVVDEQPDRQIRVEFLEQQKVADGRLRPLLASGRAVGSSQIFAWGRTGRQAGFLRE